MRGACCRARDDIIWRVMRARCDGNSALRAIECRSADACGGMRHVRLLMRMPLMRAAMFDDDDDAR